MTAVSTMAQSGGNERLPWLEPYREGRGRPRARLGKRLFAVLGGGTALVAALAGGYWLGERRALDLPAPSASASNDAQGNVAIVPVARPPSAAEPQFPASREPVRPPAPIVAAPAARPDLAPAAAPPLRKATRKRAPAIRRAAPARAGFDAVRAQQGGSATVSARTTASSSGSPGQSRQAPRMWPRLPSPGPAGRVIQLGAFSHPDRAYSAYRARLARHPELRSMPRVIVPIAPESAGGRIYYVLRMGTKSRNQSKSVCRSVRRRGDHCIVIG